MDKGEKSFDEVREGHARVVVDDILWVGGCKIFAGAQVTAIKTGIGRGW